MKCGALYLMALLAIKPDYTDTVIPPNIAPLNFTVQEEARQYRVRIHSKQGKPIHIDTRKPQITIPLRHWRKLLTTNKGQELHFDVSGRSSTGQWESFCTITNRIADAPIDGYLVYRKMYPVYSYWKDIGIYQRDLSNYRESVILHSSAFQHGCLNCHSFANNATTRMTIGIRSAEIGSSTILIDKGTVSKIGTKFGYTAWHPSGRLATYSVNSVRQFFHTVAGERRDVVDLDSLIASYTVDAGTTGITPELARKDRLESYPAWSPDGSILYFCSAPMLWSDRDKVPPEHWDEVKYDLLRISYDIDQDRWGTAETVLSAQDTGLSILEPRVSPDNHWLLFCMCDYGCFPVYRQSSDLYLMDLRAARQTGRFQYRRLDINSDQSESWHSWSSNSRWIVFSSKRDFGIFTRSYISYVDPSGRVHKPLLLPQKDPAFYESYTKTFSVPELVTEPIRVTGEKIGRVVRAPAQILVGTAITGATPKRNGPAPPRQSLPERE